MCTHFVVSTPPPSPRRSTWLVVGHYPVPLPSHQFSCQFTPLSAYIKILVVAQIVVEARRKQTLIRPVHDLYYTPNDISSTTTRLKLKFTWWAQHSLSLSDHATSARPYSNPTIYERGHLRWHAHDFNYILFMFISNFCWPPNGSPVTKC